MQPDDDDTHEVMVCGMVCRDCAYHHVECNGCRAVKGAPFWVAFVGINHCPVYECCVEEKKYEHCGQCEELPCERFTRYKNPSVSAEDAARALIIKIAHLKELQRESE